MSDREFENYLALLSGLLQLSKSQREAIAGELQDHLDQRLSALLQQGVSREDAVTMALEEFGDVTQLATEFTRSGRKQKRRWVMRLTMGSLAAAAALVFVAMALWPSPDVGPAPDRALAQAVAEEARDDAPRGRSEPANDLFADAAVSAASRNAVGEKSRDDLLNDETAAKLRALVPADFVEAPLREVLSLLGDTLDVQTYFDRRALDDNSIDTSEPVTIHLKSVPADMLLELMFRELGLTYMLRSGIVIVTTPEEAELNLALQVYNVNDLLMPRNGSARAVGVAVAVEEPRRRRGGHHDESAGFGEEGPAPRPELDAVLDRLQYYKDGASMYRHRANSLIELITTCIDPDAWDDVGGPASIQLYGGALVVRQTIQVHRQIAELLPAIRAVTERNPDIPFWPADKGPQGKSGEVKNSFD